MNLTAVAVFRSDIIEGEVLVKEHNGGVIINAYFSKLPKGKHGFHIHKGGDLRGEGCSGLCEHYDVGHNNHGGSPNSKGERHTGDLGNIEIKDGAKYVRKRYYIKNIDVTDLWGRSVIIHKDEDDLGKGNFEDSLTTGHSGARIGCAIFGRVTCKNKLSKMTRKVRKTRKTQKVQKIYTR
jgi:Cu-Zn family superoxide dismutase